MRDISSAFFSRLQQDGGQIAELIDLDCRHKSFHWTTSNERIMATLSGGLVEYLPFPGGTPNGVEESSDLGVAVIDFVMANTGDVFSSIMAGGDFGAATLRVTRIFVDTPDLGRMTIYNGQIGDYTYNRQAVTGQARNRWKGSQSNFPPYTYQDTCVWRFGSQGCGFNTQSVTITIPNSAINVASSTTVDVQLVTDTLSGYASGRFDFGRFTVTGGVNSGQVRTIRNHDGDKLTLSYPLSLNDFTDMTFDIFPGCRKRITEDCTSLYNNAENFLGFPWIPIQETAF